MALDVDEKYSKELARGKNDLQKAKASSLI